jgi:hypothetical protein
LLQILSENSIILGPIKAISDFYPNLISQDAINSISGQNYDEKQFQPFISQNSYLKNLKKPTLNEIMYECEKLIQTDTKTGKLSMRDIFSDAIENQVIYVKFELNQQGLGDWDVITSDDFKKSKENKPVFLRTKNGYNRASDRMGIQI